MSLSTTEAEIIAMSHACKEGLWIMSLMKELKQEIQSFKMYEDNMACIQILKEPRNSQRVKHIDIKYLAIRNWIEIGKILIEYISTENQIADIMTKPLSKVQFEKLRSQISLKKF